MRALAALLVLLAAAQPGTSADYRDPQGRFRFSYPAAWGTASPGTNDGFGGRLAAVRFSQFPARLGGELVLTRGFPSIDLQAAGGLYDSIALEVFPDALRRQVLARLPRLTAATFCDALGRATHLDVSLRALPGFTAAQRDAIRRLDLTRSVDPRVRLCEQDGGATTFVRETSFQEGGPRQFVFGALRFLDGEVSSVQVVAAAPNGPARIVDQMAEVVRAVRF